MWNLGATSEDQRSWISAFFASLLEDGMITNENTYCILDYGFLAECYASLEREAFTDLLVVLETLLDNTSTGKQIRVYSFFAVIPFF